MNRLLLTSLFVLTMASLTMAQGAGSQIGQDEARTIIDAMQHCIVKVAVSRMADKSADSKDVKQYAKRMVQDYTRLQGELTALAKRKRLAVPRDLEPLYREPIDRVRNLTGKEFDRTFMQMMIGFHKKDIALFEKLSEEAQDADLKSLAGRNLPMLKEHLELAEQAASKAGVE